MEASNGKVKTEALLKKVPELLTETKIGWNLGGSGPDFETLCELIKTNAIPMNELDMPSEEHDVKESRRTMQ